MFRRRRIGKWGAVVSLALLTALAAGCKAETTLEAEGQPPGYEVSMSMDPVTLNPPQLGTISYAITQDGKPVTQFEPLYGSDSLLHNILVREDLEYFRHDVGAFVVAEQVSVQALWPTTGSYKTFALFKPLGAEPQEFVGRILSGEASETANLTEGNITSKVTSGLRVDWAKGTEPVKAGEPQQIAFFVSERGQPITGLWPVYGAPGHLWIVDSSAETLGHSVGRAESRSFVTPEAVTTGTASIGPAQATAIAQATGTVRITGTPAQTRAVGTATARGTGTAGTQDGGVTSGVGSNSDPVNSERPAGVMTDTTPPTLVPNVRAALATLTARPEQVIAPVQQTAQSSIAGGPQVPPAIGFGPAVIFTHTFPEAGLYKMWLEIAYRNTVITTDWVVRVEP